MREKLMEMLDYDQCTGIFSWKISTGRVKAGSAAGSIHCNGYIRICALGKHILAHRLAWMFVHGEFPNGQIDHINGIKTDNRIINLRDVDGFINSQNIRSSKGQNKNGLLGAHKHRNKWRSRITAYGKRVNLGTMDTPQEAHKAYLEAKRKFHSGI